MQYSLDFVVINVKLLWYLNYDFGFFTTNLISSVLCGNLWNFEYSSSNGTVYIPKLHDIWCLGCFDTHQIGIWVVSSGWYPNHCQYIRRACKNPRLIPRNVSPQINSTWTTCWHTHTSNSDENFSNRTKERAPEGWR